MSDEKDFLAEQLRHKEQAEEDRYFAEQSRRQLERLRTARANAPAEGKGTCPRCGTELAITQMRGVPVEECPRGCGMWLDKEHLEEIAERQGDSWLRRLLVGSPK